MASGLTENVWAAVLTLLGVLVGWWLRHWAEKSWRRTRGSDSGLPGSGDDSHTDRLTGLSCRAAFADDLRRRVAEFKRMAEPATLLLIRIDDLGQRRASNSAERLLSSLSRALPPMVREMDHISRFDDRTFGFLLPGADQEEAAGVAQRLIQCASGCQGSADNGQPSVVVSAGIAQVEAHDTADDLLRRAQRALTQQAGEATPSACAPKIG